MPFENLLENAKNAGNRRIKIKKGQVDNSSQSLLGRNVIVYVKQYRLSMFQTSFINFKRLKEKLDNYFSNKHISMCIAASLTVLCNI